MAGGAVMATSKGGRKPLDAAINLVPFIDLLSCCISFLLITAVWVNLSQLPVRHGAGGQSQKADVPAVQLTLLVTPEAFLLSRSTGETTRIDSASRAGEPDYVGLAAAMQKAKRDLPDQDSITLRSSDGVAYERLIRTIDLLRAEKFPDVNVTDTGHSG